MKSLIQELWYGNILPQENLSNTKEMKTILGDMAKYHENLDQNITEEQRKVFEKFQECWSKYSSLSEAILFEYA